MPAARTDGDVRVAREQMSATERALAESIERYRSLFAYSPHAAFSLDLAGNFTDANAVAEQVSGYTLAEFRQMSFAELIRPRTCRRPWTRSTRPSTGLRRAWRSTCGTRTAA